MNNLKQIGLAVALYTQDYDDYYPTYYLKNDEWGGNVPWMAWMVRSNNLPWKVYRCPSSGKASPFTGWQVYGTCLATVCGGRLVYESGGKANG